MLFNYQDPTCADAPAEPSRNATTQGTKLLARRGELHRDPSDFALLEITEPIPDGYRAYLSGWNAEEGETFEQPFGIHHPRGDVKKLNARNGTASTSGFFEQGHTHWVVDRWDAGSTELGSSGSPVFDATSGSAASSTEVLALVWTPFSTTMASSRSRGKSTRLQR